MCVYLGFDLCYAHSGYHIGDSVPTSDPSNDEEVVGNIGGAKFYDQDFNGSADGLEEFAGDFCQSIWFNNENSCKSAGPSGICSDYDGGPSGGFCCGDDSNEKSVPSCGGQANFACCPSGYNYYNESTGACATSCCTWITRNCYQSSDCENTLIFPDCLTGGACNTNCVTDGICDSACCSSPNDSCVYNGKCYGGNSFVSGTDLYCHMANDSVNYLRDCDQSSWPGQASYDYCQGVCKKNTAYSGELSAFGEYPAGAAYSQCCGDDNGEYYITSFCSGYSGDPKCCNSVTDKIDASGNCVASCPAAPGSFSLTSPANNATGITSPVSLSWTAAAGTGVTYEVYYCMTDIGSSCSPTTLLTSGLAATSYSTAILSNKVYYWNVKAVSGGGSTNSSNGPFKFTSNRPPTGFNLSTPANNSTGVVQKPTLTWTASSDPEGNAITYNVYWCCAASAGCALPGSPNTSVSGTSYTFASNLTSGYYCNWNIVASDGPLQTVSSNGPFSFRVNQTPNTPSNPSPSDSATCVAVRPTLSWTSGDPDVGDTVNYQINWCTSGASCTPTAQGNSATNSFTPSSDFPASTLVRWQVVATDSKNVTTGPIWTFTTSLGTPVATITDPANSSCTNGDDTVAVSWSAGDEPVWGYSSDSVCNDSDSYPNSGASVTISATRSDYVCFENSNYCAIGYSAALGQLKVDKTAPTITNVTTSSSVCEQVVFSVNGAADSGCGGLAASAYSFNGGSTWQSGNTYTLSTGTGISATIAANQIKVRDAVGNIYTYSSSVAGTANDCDQIDITFNPESSSYSYNNVNVIINATDPDGVKSNATYCWTTSSSCTPSTAFTLGSTVTQNTSGAWTLCATATDNNNISATECSGKYYIDKIAPTITSLSSSATSVCSGAGVSFTFAATDTGGSGLSAYELWSRPSGGSWGQVSSCSASPCTVNPTVTTEYGLHAKDAAGNCIAEDGTHCAGVASDTLDTRASQGPDTVSIIAVPGAPGDPSYSNTTDSSTRVTWTAATGATSYDIYRCTGSGCSQPGAATYTGRTSPFTDGSLNCGTTYRYWIEAKNSCGNTLSSQGTSVTTNACTDPTITFNPASRSYNYTDASVTVNASDPDGMNQTGSYCWTTDASCTPSSSFTLGSALTQNTSGEWNLCVKATDSLGNSRTSCSGPYNVDKIAPTIISFSPSGTSVCAGSSITISFAATDTGGSGLSTFELWQKPSGGSWSQVAGCSASPCTVSPTVTTEYGLHVKDVAGNCIAEDSTHCAGVTSDSLDTRTSQGPDTITVTALPGTPGNPTYSATGESGTTVTWSAATGATSYDVYRCVGASCSRPATATHSGKTSPFTDSGLNCNTTYRYWIEAKNSCGSAFSSQGGSVTTGACTVPITINPGSQVCSQNNPSTTITIADADGVSYGRWAICKDATCDPGSINANSSPFACSGATPCVANLNESVDTGAWKICARGRDTLSNWSSLICSDGYYNVDKTIPTVDSFTVEGVSAGGSIIIASGEKPTVKWSTTDVGCAGFKNVSLWRANYNATNCNGATMSGCSWSTIWTDTNEDNITTGKDDTTVGATGDYWYGIHVNDNVNNCSLENNVACSSSGNPVRVTIAGSGACTTAPGQPTGLSHTANTTNSITWQWSAPTSGDAPSEYRIYNSSNQLIGTSAGTIYVQTKASESGSALTADTSYTVYVVAANACGSGAASASATAYTSASTPASCSGAAVSSSAINWSWVSGGNQSGYYASNSAGNSNWITGTTWGQTGLACGTTYTTSLKARNHDAEETGSVQCSATTSACPPTGGALDANFQWCAANNNVIIFLDTSTGGTGGVTGWTWNFGDGLGANSLCLSNCNTGSYNGGNQYPVHYYSPSTPPDWANANWVYRRKITFDNSGRAALSNFTVLVKQTSSDTGFWSHVQNDGDDLRFFDSNNTTELYYEVEKFDYANKELLAWVKVPQVDGTNTDNIYMYYGNASASATTYKKTAPTPANTVWDSNYKMIWHLNDASGRLQDSTSNNIDSTSEAGLSYRATGQIGYGVSLASGWQASNITRSDIAGLRQYPFTWEFWYKGTLTSGNYFMWSQDIGWRLSNGTSYIYEWKDEGGDDFNVGSVRNSGGTHDNNTWYQGALSFYNTGDNRVKFYRNGALFYQGGGVNSPALTGSIDWTNWVWNYPNSAAIIFDEIRISAGARSADWLAFQYCNMKQTCLTYGAEENGSPLTDYSVVFTARDSVNNTDQSIQTVSLDPANHGCAALGCEAACYTPTACSTAQCSSYSPVSGLTQTYRQTRASVCPDNCHCSAWSAYTSCQLSYQNCSVQCYTGTGCKTASNECYCDAGYVANPASPGSCKLKEFKLQEVTALGSEQLSLIWEIQEVATDYLIYRDGALIDTESAVNICNSGVCSYTDVGLTPGTTYRYDIFAVVGGTGIYNSTVLPSCGGTNNAQCPRYGITDSVVSNFTITTTCGQLSLGWDNINVLGISGYTYQIYKGTSPNPTELFKEMSKNTSSCPTGTVECLVCADNASRCLINDKEIVPKVRYYYKIVTINESGDPSYDDATADASSYCYEAPGWEER